MSWPSVSESGRIIDGGLTTNDAYIALTVALGLYTASHIAEIIRGSILAVHKGQNEAANALALSGFQRYRFIVLPQAFRIAIPAIINQFLNLTKNTSLAVVRRLPRCHRRDPNRDRQRSAGNSDGDGPHVDLPHVLAHDLTGVEPRESKLPSGGEVMS